MRTLLLALFSIATISAAQTTQATGNVNGGPAVPITLGAMPGLSMGTGSFTQSAIVGSTPVTAGYIPAFQAGTNLLANAGTAGMSYGGIIMPTTAVPVGSNFASGVSVEYARSGNAQVIFDGQTAVGDFVIPSVITGGQAHDSGLTTSSLVSCTVPIVGVVAVANAGAGTASLVRLHSIGSYGTLCNASVSTSPAFPSASIAAGGKQTQTATVQGAQVPSGATNVPNSGCHAEPLTDPGSTAIAFTCFVTAANTITLGELNTNQAALGGAAVTPNAVSVRYRVF